MWCPNDKRGCVTNTVGQISPNTTVGKLLIDLVSSTPLQTIVDIGTWNGLGSTRCFLMGLQESTRLISLETNREKNELAKRNLASLMKPHADICWGSILKPSDLVDLETVFPEFKDSGEFQRWHSIDVANLEAAPYVLDKVPATLDFVLFDGGEFTTYYEFQVLFPRCTRYIALDDVHTPKCKRIRTLLQESVDWKEIKYIPERNGFSLFEKQ